jgi:hypothetical protein
LKIFAGVDTDSLLGPEDRYEDCHFSGSGQEKFATAWIEILRSAATRTLETHAVGSSEN